MRCMVDNHENTLQRAHLLKPIRFQRFQHCRAGVTDNSRPPPAQLRTADWDWNGWEEPWSRGAPGGPLAGASSRPVSWRGTRPRSAAFPHASRRTWSAALIASGFSTVQCLNPGATRKRDPALNMNKSATEHKRWRDISLQQQSACRRTTFRAAPHYCVPDSLVVFASAARAAGPEFDSPFGISSVLSVLSVP